MQLLDPVVPSWLEPLGLHCSDRHWRSFSSQDAHEGQSSCGSRGWRKYIGETDKKHETAKRVTLHRTAQGKSRVELLHVRAGASPHSPLGSIGSKYYSRLHIQTPAHKQQLSLLLHPQTGHTALDTGCMAPSTAEPLCIWKRAV